MQDGDSRALSVGTSPFLAGLRAAMPLWLGITPYGLAYGLLGQTVGLGAGGTLAMSVFVFAGSAQFVALGLLGAGASYASIVLATLVVNLRHLLYGASLAPHLQEQPVRWKAAISFLLTDETFAVVAGHLREQGTIGRDFYLGVGLSIYLDWILSTVTGLALGGLLPDPAALGLDFALPATFIGLLAQQLRGLPAWAALVAAGALVLLTAHLPGRLGIVLTIIVAATVGWGMERWLSRC